MIYTRPQVQPLNLDLLDLHGGGSCPSQFFGRTTDDRPLCIKYRGGCLIVRCGAPGGSDGSEDHLASFQIGPWLHGEILLEQVCDILGLTIRGATPHLADEDRIRAAEDGQILDWSGRTTYWEELIQVTPGGAIHFVGALQVEFHDLHILENTFQGHRRVFMLRDSIAECEHWTTLGICPNQERLRLLLASDNATLADRDFAFEHIIDLGHSLNVGKSDASTTNCQHFHSKFLTVFGDEAVLADGLRAGFVRAMFPTDAPKSIDFITRLQAVTDRCFSRRVAWVESHGHLLEIGEEHALHSRDMADWCRQSPRHFIGWSERDFGNGKIVVGIRAI